MLAPQRHVLTMFEYLSDIVLVVLRTKTQQNPGFLLRPHKLLQLAERRIKRDSPWPVLTAHSAPERMIAVQGDHFVRRPFQGVIFPDQRRCQRREENRRVWHVR